MFDFDETTVGSMADGELTEMRRNLEGWIVAYGETAEIQYVDRTYSKLLIVKAEQERQAFAARDAAEKERFMYDSPELADLWFDC